MGVEVMYKKRYALVMLGMIMMFSGCTGSKDEEEFNYDKDTILKCMETLGEIRYLGLENTDTELLENNLDSDTYNGIISAMSDKGQPYVDVTKYVVAQAEELEAMYSVNQKSTIPSEFDTSELMSQIESYDAESRAREASAEESRQEASQSELDDKNVSMDIIKRPSHIVTDTYEKSGEDRVYSDDTEDTKDNNYNVDYPLDTVKYNMYLTGTTSEFGITPEDTEEYGGTTRSNQFYDSIISKYIELDTKITFLTDTEQYVVMADKIDTENSANTIKVGDCQYVFNGERIKQGIDTLIGNYDYDYEVIGYTLCNDGYIIITYTTIADGFKVYAYMDKDNKIHIDNIEDLVKGVND